MPSIKMFTQLFTTAGTLSIVLSCEDTSSVKSFLLHENYLVLIVDVVIQFNEVQWIRSQYAM